MTWNVFLIGIPLLELFVFSNGVSITLQGKTLSVVGVVNTASVFTPSVSCIIDKSSYNKSDIFFVVNSYIICKLLSTFRIFVFLLLQY